MRQFALTLVLVLLLSGCIQTEAGPEKDLPQQRGSTEACISIEQFNASRDTGKCWVLVDGWVYDVSNTTKGLWGLDFMHQGLHSCGEDLSEEILRSPHGPSKIEPYRLGPVCQP